MNTRIEMTTKEPWKTFMKFTYTTLGKEPPEKILNKVPTVDDWLDYLIPNHSTLRCVEFIVYDKLPKSVINQLLRATKGHPQPEVESSRPDWNNGKERSSDPYELKMFAQKHTAESFIELCKQRMCNRTEERTRDTIHKWMGVLYKSNDPFFHALWSICNPSCIWLGFCPERKRTCGYSKTNIFNTIRNKHISHCEGENNGQT